METSKNQQVKLTELQHELLVTVFEFYGRGSLLHFIFSRKSLLIVIDFLIHELKLKLKISPVRYHYILKSDISDLKLLYRQIHGSNFS